MRVSTLLLYLGGIVLNHLQSIEKEMSIRHIWEARKRIARIINRTPLIQSFVLSELAGRPVYLKLENTHDIGAFKVRGAANKILSLSDEEKKARSSDVFHRQSWHGGGICRQNAWN